MNESRFRITRPGVAALPICLLSGGLISALAAPPSACALAPDSPEVQQLVVKAIKFLEQPVPRALTANLNNVRPGARALTGLCMIKHYGEAAKTNARVTEAVESIRAVAMRDPIFLDVYNTGICLVFLFELDPSAYRPEIERLHAHLLGMQKGHGGWGYLDKPTGDTSMTQYGILGLWAAEKSGLQSPDDAWERAVNWLMRTQDPSGAWGYQGTDPGSFSLVPQSEVRISLAAAGTSSIYICGDRLGLFGPAPTDKSQPEAIKPVEDPNRKRSAAVSSQNYAEVKTRAKRYLRDKYTMSAEQWSYYYLYAYERYQSFRELAPGEDPEPTPWYDDGYKFLAKEQQADGSWTGPPGNNTVADTCFSVLFLLRTTKKSLQRVKGLGAGVLTGGRGIPGSGDLSVRLGSVVAKPLSGPAEDLLAIMEDPANPEFFRAVETLEELSSKGDIKSLSQHTERLRALVGGTSAPARAAALRALSRTRNMDDVPLLIEALKDPAPEVFRAAYNGLRFVSRKFGGVGYAAGSTAEERAGAREAWKAWFLTIRPDTQFDD